MQALPGYSRTIMSQVLLQIHPFNSFRCVRALAPQYFLKARSCCRATLHGKFSSWL